MTIPRIEKNFRLKSLREVVGTVKTFAEALTDCNMKY